MITFKKWRQLKLRMQSLEIIDTSLEEKFIAGGGRGGQKVNKTASCVWLKHIPTGLIVKTQQSRLRVDNRYHARVLLCDKIAAKTKAEKTKQQQLAEKIRRQKKRRSRRAKLKILENKAKQSKKKQLRNPPKHDG